ncbi:MAG: beta-lactamase family protein [Chloroflexota bacterium]|nr:beta-lactamase family protein [Chloroflexota bacterium]
MEIGSHVQELLDAAGAPGATVALSIEGEIWATGVGFADAAHSEPLPADARFGLYSITKTIIATIVLGLAEDRVLALDDPIGDALPELPFDTPVSIRQLLNHTGGLPDYGESAAYREAVRDHPGAPWTADEFLRRTLGEGLLYMPGHGWRYSNIGYLLLRLMLERETGLTFPQVIRHYLALPAGLDALAAIDSLAEASALTPGYGRAANGNGDGGFENVIARYHPGWVAHGLATATAPGLARFFDLLFGGEWLGAESLDAMTTPVPVTTSHPWMTKPSYGLGLMMDPANRFGAVAGHTGGGPGYATAAYRFPDVHGHQVTSVALVNRDGADTATDIVFLMVAQLADRLESQS